MTHRPVVGVYPGTFDPITKGHLDVIGRARRIVDHLIVAVATNAGKGPLFSVDERVEMVRNDVATLAPEDGATVEVRFFDRLLMDFVVQQGAKVIVRGLRAVSDFEYEFQMAAMNARLNPRVETVFLTASERQHFVASRLVKEIGALGGDITSFVTPQVAARLEERFGRSRPGDAAE